MRKMLILASLASLMVMGTPVAEAETTFTQTPYRDIANHWAQKEIEKLYIAGVVGDAEAFRPDDPVTRGELIALFIKAKGIEPIKTGQSSFADIPNDSWLVPYAETAYRLGIVHGRQQGSQVYLHPEETVKREELVSVLIRAMGKSGAVNSFPWSATVQSLARFPDGGKVEKQFQRPLAYALQNNLVSAYQDGTLKPQQQMTRAEAATYAALRLLSDPKGKEKQTLTPVGTPFRQMLTVETTAYSDNENEPLSYLEYPMRKGVVAVDPRVIPLGSHLYIDGYGYAVAADIGGAVKERHVDLYLPTIQEAKQYGMKQGVKVYVLD